MSARQIVAQLTNLTEMENTFTSSVKTLNVHNGASIARGVSAQVQWSLDFDARSWGVKGLEITVARLHVSWDDVNDSGPEDQVTPQQIDWKAGDPGWKVSAERAPGSDQIFPKSLTISKEDQMIVVHF